MRAGMTADQTRVTADQVRGWQRTSECVIYSRCLSQMASTLEAAEYARRV